VVTSSSVSLRRSSPSTPTGSACAHS
jgi:hypothetical protein